LKLVTGQQIEDLIIEVEAGSLQKIEYIPVIQSHGSIGLGALIPGGIRDANVSLDPDCALVKGELHGFLFALGYSLEEKGKKQLNAVGHNCP